MDVSRPGEFETPAGRQSLAAQLAEARREFVDAATAGRGGGVAHARFSGQIDALLRRVVSAAEGLTTTPVAIAALGGYGRQAMCLYSDVDLLLVFDGPIGHADERFVKAVLHPLWDLGLRVGQQVRTLADIADADVDDPEFLLSMVDARHLAGDVRVFARASEAFRLAGRERRHEVLEALLRLTDERHQRFNDTIYQLEPDVKDAPGSLRDAMAAHVLDVLADEPVTADPDAGPRLGAAVEFLLRVRAVVHLECGRNVNALTHELQDVAAGRMDYQGGQPHQRVEALMTDYFRHARVVAGALARARRTAGPAARDTTRVPLAHGVELTAEGIGFVDDVRDASDPASWLGVFEAALAHGVPVADAALAAIERRTAGAAPGACLPTREHRERLLALLRPRPGLHARLAEMHRCGFLECLFPEFRAISCRVIRDFYHKYTVDEHTLLTVRGLERLLAPAARLRQRFSTLLAELPSPELVVLALLFHDVGKWKEDDHAAESARMVQGVLERLDLLAAARESVTFLIAEHLALSRIAFRRDSEDPDIVRRFAALVGTEERLKMLCLMTLVDVEAVAPGTLTPWREELLWRLYVDTYNELTLEYGEHRIDRGHRAVARLLETCPPDIDRAHLTKFLEGFPERYLVMFDAAQVYLHTRLARDMQPGGVHLFLEQKGETWEMAVATTDTPYLFSNICGVLSYFGMDILRGTAMTNPAGLVLDIFQFVDRDRFLRLNADGVARLGQVLTDAVAGREDVTALLRRRASGLGTRRVPGQVAPVVRFATEHSHRYSVLEIVAQDAPGLLHRISRAISQHGCNVDLVLISTEGNKAIDVFHLTRSAATLAESDQMALTTALAQLLEEPQ